MTTFFYAATEAEENKVLVFFEARIPTPSYPQREALTR
jgi:hypothetical protein